jgi:hypothetical protein
MNQENDGTEKKAKRTGGVESSLQGFGIFFAGCSIAALIFFIVVSQQEIIQKAGIAALFIALGIGAIIQGFTVKILFEAASEVIRLLKRLNGLAYGGTISQSNGDGDLFVCSACDEPVAIEQKFCSQCGSAL